MRVRDGDPLHMDEASNVKWERVERLSCYMVSGKGFLSVGTERRADAISAEFRAAYPQFTTWHNNIEARFARELVEEW